MEDSLRHLAVVGVPHSGAGSAVTHLNARADNAGELRRYASSYRPTCAEREIFVLHSRPVLRVHKSALKHGCTVEDISHAVDLALYESVLDEDSDPPKLLIIGPDSAGNLLELIGGELADDALLIWHADRCRRSYRNLLPTRGGEP